MLILSFVVTMGLVIMAVIASSKEVAERASSGEYGGDKIPGEQHLIGRYYLISLMMLSACALFGVFNGVTIPIIITSLFVFIMYMMIATVIIRVYLSYVYDMLGKNYARERVKPHRGSGIYIDR